MPWIVAGLGNPEPGYAGHRHNIGFMVVDELARRCGETWRDKFHGHMARFRAGDHDAVLLKPMTYMNRSGISLGAAASFYKVPPKEVVVVHDELDLPFAGLQVKVGGGHGGHNGLRSIFEHFGKDFTRVRCGIGRPPHGDVTNWVLSDFGTEERAELDDFVYTAADAVEAVLRDGPRAAMNAYNGKASRQA